MLSPLLPLVILLVILTLALLTVVWLLVSQTRRSAEKQLTMLQQAFSSTTMTLVAMAKETREALTEHSAKTLGATTALAEKAIRGASSIAEQQAKTTDALIPLLASKDPIAYSQLRQTDVALSPDASANPYPAVDDAEWQRLTEEQVAGREQDAQAAAEGRAWLSEHGVNVDAIGFPAADQGQ